MPKLFIDGLSFKVNGYLGWSASALEPGASVVCFVEAGIEIPPNVQTNSLNTGSTHIMLDLEDGRVFEGAEMWQAGDLITDGDTMRVRYEGRSLNGRDA